MGTVIVHWPEVPTRSYEVTIFFRPLKPLHSLQRPQPHPALPSLLPAVSVGPAEEPVVEHLLLIHGVRKPMRL